MTAAGNGRPTVAGEIESEGARRDKDADKDDKAGGGLIERDGLSKVGWACAA